MRQSGNAVQCTGNVLVWRDKGNDTMLVPKRVSGLSQPLLFILKTPAMTIHSGCFIYLSILFLIAFQTAYQSSFAVLIFRQFFFFASDYISWSFRNKAFVVQFFL